MTDDETRWLARGLTLFDDLRTLGVSETRLTLDTALSVGRMLEQHEDNMLRLASLARARKHRR